MGAQATVRAFLGTANQQQPASVGNSIVLGVFPCKKDDHTALESICAVWLADIEELRANGIQVRGETRAGLVILTGDYKWMTAFVGHSGPGAGMPCLWCTAVARPTLTNAAIVQEFGCLQDGSRCTGRRRHVAHALRMSARYAAGPNASLARPRSLRRHLSIERRPLMVLAACDIAPMPLHLTLGTTVALLQLAVEAVTFSFGEVAGLTFCASMGEILRRDAGVSPASYFGGTFEGRECHRIGRKLMLVADLMDTHAPGPGATAWRRVCSQWQVLLPTLNRADTIADGDITHFGTCATAFMDGLNSGFAWYSVTPKMHALCCHVTAFLWRFGSVGRYSEQGLESLHGRFNQDPARYTAATFLGSCEAFVKGVSCRRAARPCRPQQFAETLSGRGRGPCPVTSAHERSRNRLGSHRDPPRVVPRRPPIWPRGWRVWPERRPPGFRLIGRVWRMPAHGRSRRGGGPPQTLLPCVGGKTMGCCRTVRPRL